MKMNREEVKEMIQINNTRIDYYMNNQLVVDMGYPEGTKEMPMNDWFKAQECIKNQHFYEKSKKLLDVCRADGWDVKINMQNSKLSFNGTL